MAKSTTFDFLKAFEAQGGARRDPLREEVHGYSGNPIQVPQ
jgi:hypothetical protein